MKTNFSRRIVAVAVILIAAGFSLRAQTNVAAITPQAVLAILQRVGDWQLANPATNRVTGWIQSVSDVGIMALAGISGDPKYRDAMLAKGEAEHWILPQYQGRRYHADDQCYGQVCTELYFLYRENRMIAPMREHFDWIMANPAPPQRRDPKLGDDQWNWCDALFMAPPSWLRLYAATGDEKYMNFAVTNWWRTTDYLYSTNDHLFYRDSTFFNKTETNGAKVYWSRGNGWVFAATVRMLQYLPMNHPDRPRFEQLFKEMADKILTLQQPDGMWRASLLDPEDYPTPEASGSAMFVYGLAWGVNQGLLDRTKYEPAVVKAWTALVGCVNADGRLTHVQPAGDHPIQFSADATAPYGGGVFLLAGCEIYRMAVLKKTAPNASTIIPLIQFQDASLKFVIESLARQAGINCIFDPKIGYWQPDKNGIKSEPNLSIHWLNLTAGHALDAVLDEYKLQITSDPNTEFFEVTKQNTNLPAIKIALLGAVSVKNPSLFRRDCETVELNLTGKHVVMDGISSRILDSQNYSTDSNSAPDKLLFQVDLAPGETRTFYILDASALPTVPPPIVKTFARYVPERMDDFAWESDRTAHRLYGQALIKGEGTITSGIDAWIKNSHHLIMDEMYRTGHYHMDNGDEMDDYRVGKSSGDGGSGIWDGVKLHAPINYRNWKLITTGPIRSEFEVTYDAWDAGDGRKVSLTKRISIDAGSWLSKAQDTFALVVNADAAPIDMRFHALLTVGVGLAERACPTNRVEFITHDLSEGWTAYWQPEDQPKGVMGVAVILPKGGVTAFTNDAPNLPDSVVHADVPQPTHEGYPPMRNMLAIAQAEVGKPFTYYFGACWDRSGDFTNHVAWENYVKRFAERRDQPLQVTVGN